MATQDELTPDASDVQGPDFRDVSGEMPVGNVSAADSTGGDASGPLQSSDGSGTKPAVPDPADFPDDDPAEYDAIVKRQVADYEAGIDDGKQP